MLYRQTRRDAVPGILLIHGETGLTGWDKAQARRLACQGYAVLAVDLYRGEGVAGDAMDSHIMGRALPEDRVQADLHAALDFLARQPGIRADRLGVLGWDTGGGYALDLALADPRARAVVVCYGRLTTDARLLKPLQGSVLGIFAGQDEGISPVTLEQFRAAMQKAGKRVAGLTVLPQARHGFLNPADAKTYGPSPESSRQEAWQAIDRYLAAELHR